MYSIDKICGALSEEKEMICIGKKNHRGNHKFRYMNKVWMLKYIEYLANKM